MRIAAFDGGKPGVVASDDTIVDIRDLLEQYDPSGPRTTYPISSPISMSCAPSWSDASKWVVEHR